MKHKLAALGPVFHYISTNHGDARTTPLTKLVSCKSIVVEVCSRVVDCICMWCVRRVDGADRRETCAPREALAERWPHRRPPTSRIHLGCKPTTILRHTNTFVRQEHRLGERVGGCLELLAAWSQTCSPFHHSRRLIHIPPMLPGGAPTTPTIL